MNKVVTITIGSSAFDLEEGAYDALRAYLDAARTSLAGNPDQEEIVNDLEQAIAQKCSACMSNGKTVVSTADMAHILAEMGPVHSSAQADSSSSSSRTQENATAPKRLFRLREGRMVFGVCSGLAAYFNIDVVLVRVLFVLATLLTSGGFILAYFIMMVLIPEADTPQERAAAYGTMPITAQQLIDRAKEGYEHFKNSGEWQRWKRQMHQEARQWKQQWKQQQRQSRHHYNYAGNYNHVYQGRPSPLAEVAQAVFGVVWILFMIFCAWFLYHHVLLAHEFFDTLWGWWNSLVYAVVQAVQR